jgi:hypothetical protein
VPRRYDAGMRGLDPTVTGALIAGGAALIGFGASALSNQATLRVNRKMQRDQLLWDKKTALYEAIDAALISGDLHVPAPLPSEIRAKLNESLTATDQLRPAYRLYASPDVRREVTNYRNVIRDLLSADERYDPSVMISYRLIRGVHEAMRDDVQGNESQELSSRLAKRARIRDIMGK